MSTPPPRTSSARNEVRTVAPKLIELITAMTAGRIAKQVFEEKKS